MDLLFTNPWMQFSMGAFASMLVIVIVLGFPRLMASGSDLPSYLKKISWAILAYGITLTVFSNLKGGPPDPIFYVSGMLLFLLAGIVRVFPAKRLLGAFSTIEGKFLILEKFLGSTHAMSVERVNISKGLAKRVLRLAGWSVDEIGRYTMTAANSDHVEIVFKRDMWAQLFPIEKALAVTLQSDEYSIEKHTDRIIVRVKSADRLGEVLSAAIPMIAGLEAVSPGEVESLSISPVGGDEEVLKDDNLVRIAKVVEPVVSLERPNSKELDLPRKTLIRAAEGVPIAGGVLGFWLETWLKNADEIGTIFTAFQGFFAAAKGLNEFDSDIKEVKVPPPDDKESAADKSKGDDR